MIITRDQYLHQRITPRDNRFFASQQPYISLVERDCSAVSEQNIPIVLPGGPDSLPKALLTPQEDGHPFGDHIPRLWQYYPFILTENVVGLDSNDSGNLGTVLQGDPYAPHWTDQSGYRLFDEYGQASAFLNQMLLGLRDMQQEIMQTQQLVWRLQSLRVLIPCTAYHQGNCFSIYRVDKTRLMTAIGHSIEEVDRRMLALVEAMEGSQAGMPIHDASQLSSHRQNC